jgi:hypothetical protein
MKSSHPTVFAEPPSNTTAKAHKKERRKESRSQKRISKKPNIES